MCPQKVSSQLRFFKLTALGAVIVILFTLFSLVDTASSQAPEKEVSTPQIEMVPPEQEKKFHIGVPAHLPLKIKVKNVNSKRWVHDIEVEVTNTSDKQIYFLDFYIVLPGINGLMGSKVGFWLHYGRAELLDFTIPLLPDDVPLQPGEKYTFKIPESSAKGWDYLREKEGRPEPRVMKLMFQRINFGDGTGYLDSSGAPVNIHRKMSLNKTCVPPPNGSRQVPTIFSVQAGCQRSLWEKALTCVPQRDTNCPRAAVLAFNFLRSNCDSGSVRFRRDSLPFVKRS